MAADAIISPLRRLDVVVVVREGTHADVTGDRHIVKERMTKKE
jgi:hypothetical protein